MKFESLSTEPLIYMLMHSGAFVGVLGVIFFIVGLLFGYATWGRYKRQTRELRGQVDAMKDEIAGLKRKVGDHAVKPGPAIAMATETIHMPKKEGSAAAEAVPAVTDENITTQDARPLPPIKEPPPKPQANVIKPKAPSPLVVPSVVEPAASQTDKTPEPPPAESAPVIPAEPTTFILAEPAPATPAEPATPAPEAAPPPAAEAARHASPLAAIIATPPVKEEAVAEFDPSATPAGLVIADTIPALVELPPMTPLPAVEILPEVDPSLGLIYKSQPQHVDDLTALEGIAQGLAQRLHELGIYTYAQIAAWNEDHIKEFSARLAFKDRIQREHWVEQAKQLAAKQVAV